MATTTVPRSAWTDDSGGGTDGSIINNAELQKIYANVDALIAGDIVWGGSAQYAAGKTIGWSDGYFERTGANAIKLWNGAAVGTLTANLTGNVTGNVTGNLTGTILTASQTNITAVGTLVGGATGSGFTVALGTSTITGQLGVANGGTGLASVTANRIPYGNGTSALQTSASLTFDGTTLLSLGQEIRSQNASQAGFYANYTGTGALAASWSTFNDTSAWFDETNARYIWKYTASTNGLSTPGLLTVSSVGTHAFSGNSNAAQTLNIRNANAGASTQSQLTIGNDGSAAVALFGVDSSGVGTGGLDAANVTYLYTGHAAGFNIGATNASGAIRFYSGGATIAGTINASRGWSVNEDFDPGVGHLSVSWTGGRATLQGGHSGTAADGGPRLTLDDGDYGQNCQPPLVIIGRNSNASSLMAGAIKYSDKNGSVEYLWPDASGNLRIGGSGPNPALGGGDTSGTVVGTQTSTLDTKRLINDGDVTVTPAAAYARLVHDRLYRYDRYGALSGSIWTGPAIDTSEWFGMDPDEGHPHGRSGSLDNFAGYVMLGFRYVDARMLALQAEIDHLKGQLVH